MLAPLRPRVLCPSGLYSYHAGFLFDPGAERAAFEMRFGLPLFDALGIDVRAGALLPLQPPQVYVNLANRIAGIGGLVAGNIALQSLTTPEEGG